MGSCVDRVEGGGPVKGASNTPLQRHTHQMIPPLDMFRNQFDPGFGMPEGFDPENILKQVPKLVLF